MIVDERIDMEIFDGVLGIIIAVILLGMVIWVMLKGANQKKGLFKIYLAGTMSGNQSNSLVNQDYRDKITDILTEVYPDIIIDDPYRDHKNSLYYDDEEARKAFSDCLRRSAYEADMLIAYIPEASMGTALEIYEASKAGKYIVIITPFLNNWIVRLYGDITFSSIETFSAWVYDHALDPIIYGGINDFDGSRLGKPKKIC